MNVPCPICKGTKEKDGKPCSQCGGKGELKVVVAPHERSGYLSMFVDQVLDVVREIAEIDGEIMITDLSSIQDFFAFEPMELREKKAREIGERLGIEIKATDTIVDLAQRLKNL